MALVICKKGKFYTLKKLVADLERLLLYLVPIADIPWPVSSLTPHGGEIRNFICLLSSSLTQIAQVSLLDHKLSTGRDHLCRLLHREKLKGKCEFTGTWGPLNWCCTQCNFPDRWVVPVVLSMLWPTWSTCMTVGSPRRRREGRKRRSSVCNSELEPSR